MASSVLQAPIEGYTSSISEMFPLIMRRPALETSILAKEKVDILPTNITPNHALTGNYLEFRIPSTLGTFIDLAQIWFDTRIKITKGPAGEALTEEDSCFLANGLANTLFKSVHVYFNDKLVESNPFYSYTAYIRMLQTFSKQMVEQQGALGGLYNMPQVRSTYTREEMDTLLPPDMKLLRTQVATEGGKRLYFPLVLDVNTVDQYLIDNVSIRIRLELNSPSWIVTGATDQGHNQAYNLSLEETRLWVNKITPQPNAMTAFYRSFTKDISYMFDKFLHKTYVLPAQQTVLTCELPFNHTIPERLYMLILDMEGHSGARTRYPLHLDHANLNSFHVTINGTTITNPQVGFPHNAEGVFADLLQCVGFGKPHMIDFEQFKAGQSIFAVDFRPEQLEGLLTYEKTGNMRISMTFASGNPRNQLVLLLADTNGFINISPDLNVVTDTRG